jgi:2-polyprenyl-3-methyl-5-hydroxy-6-metoxy-1,4-benzoquinol methylase
MATQHLRKSAVSGVEFQCRDFARLGPSKYDIVFISNLYQLLEPQQRAELRDTVKRILQPGGLLFLSTLSVSDPEHYGKGIPIVGEVSSFLDEKYIHFCTQEELERDFGFLTIKELQLHEYHEPRSTGEAHHHIAWLLVGENPVTG